MSTFKALPYNLFNEAEIFNRLVVQLMNIYEGLDGGVKMSVVS